MSIIVASVSCIYGLGSPSDYKRDDGLHPEGRDHRPRQHAAPARSTSSTSGTTSRSSAAPFRVRGDTIDVWPASEEFAYRIELFGDEVDALSVIHPLSGEAIKPLEDLYIYPAKHFVTPRGSRSRGHQGASKRNWRSGWSSSRPKARFSKLERLKARTRYDLDMLREVGYCSGIENYARWFSGRAPGEPPYTLIDFFPEDFLLVVDESHVTLPQVRGMYFGDRSRKETLVEHGFRLPRALDNRPLKFDEFEMRADRCACASPRRPGQYELEKTGGEVVEQVIRPTGLVDPVDPHQTGPRPGEGPRSGSPQPRRESRNARSSPC